MNRPGIRTAIPKHRYRLGEFTVTVLGEIESSDGVSYRYIMAVIHGQDPQPGMYITAEQPAGTTGKQLDMRLIMPDGEELIGRDALWWQLDAFTRDGIGIVSRVLNLSDETPWELLQGAR
jgi:hypothetical protein